MSLLKVNTTELHEISKEIMELSYKYNEIVNKYYQRINGINGKTNEWSGEDANHFIDTINKEKDIYQTVGKIMRDYSIQLDGYVKTVEELVKLNSI